MSSYPQPPLRRGHGCTVGIDRDPPVWPSTQAGWWRYQSASSYVRAYGLCVLRAHGRVCGRCIYGVSAVDSRKFRIKSITIIIEPIIILIIIIINFLIIEKTILILSTERIVTQIRIVEIKMISTIIEIINLKK